MRQCNHIHNNKFINLMKEQENNTSLGISPQQPQLNTRLQHYDIDEMRQSKIYSVTTLTNNPHNLLKYFQQYKPNCQNFIISKLHSSQNLKIKKYKQSIYYGQFINGKKHGIGIMIYDNNRLYQGSWECDYKHGIGYERFPNLCVYQGDYVNGKPEGIGRYGWPNGQFYQGEWLNGMKQGSGMWKGGKGDSYIGQWKFGKADGYGVHTWINGDRYEGEFKQCLKHGQGIQKFANGDIYKGIYVNGKPCGFGQYYWGNGSYFKGIFKNGLRDGQGVWKRGTGATDKYEGQYINDKKCGYGIFTWSTGNVYKGNYDSDARNGYGQMYWSDGSFYKGQWKNGIQNGQGLIYVPGQGYNRGIFENNVLVLPSKSGQTSSNPYTSLQEEIPQEDLHNPQQGFYRTKKKDNTISSRLLPNRINFRKTGISTKNKTKSIDQNIISFCHGGRQSPYQSLNPKKNSQKHYIFPNKFMSQQQSKYPNPQHRSQKYQPQQKQRVLHSSFYLHKLHNKTNTSISVSRADGKRYQSLSQDYHKGKTRDIIQQMKIFHKSKISHHRNPHP